MRVILTVLLVLPLLAFAQTVAPDPLSYTLPSGKTLHFESVEAKAKFLAAQERRQQAQAAQPTPAPHSPAPMGQTLLDTGGTTSAGAGTSRPNPRPAYEDGGGLKKLAKMRVAEVEASPFTLEGIMVELVDVEKVERREVAAGKYRLTIHGKDDRGRLVGYLPAQTASLAEGSKNLIVSVVDPSAPTPEVQILGNAVDYEGLSTTPKPVWR